MKTVVEQHKEFLNILDIHIPRIQSIDIHLRPEKVTMMDLTYAVVGDDAENLRTVMKTYELRDRTEYTEGFEPYIFF